MRVCHTLYTHAEQVWGGGVKSIVVAQTNLLTTLI